MTVAIEDDVVVVGSGLAGSMAALAAAEDGAGVRLLTHKESTLQQASGLVDLLGYLPGDDEPMVDPFDAIPDLPDGHPYRTVDISGVREGFALFDAVTDYAGGHTDRNALVPTFGGSVKPTARYPESVAAGLASDDRSTLLVGFETMPDFDAPLAADHLENAGVPFDVRGVTLLFPGGFRTDAKITRLAHALDENERVERERDGYHESLPIRRALAERVEPHLDGAERVGFPAIVGESRPVAVQSDLEDALDAAVFEVPTGPPSLPGMRLSGRLSEALEAAGVAVTAGNPVIGYELDSSRSGASAPETSAEGGASPTRAATDRIRSVVVERNGAEIPFHAEQFVLATGGLVGKGIDSDRGGVREPVFDCHVPHPADRYDWFDDEAFGDHPFARFGVETDDDLRPLGSGGGVEFENLRAAGAVLGGFDFAAEKSGSGVSIATGAVAGRRASEEVNERR